MQTYSSASLATESKQVYASGDSSRLPDQTSLPTHTPTYSSSSLSATKNIAIGTGSLDHALLPTCAPSHMSAPISSSMKNTYGARGAVSISSDSIPVSAANYASLALNNKKIASGGRQLGDNVALPGGTHQQGVEVPHVKKGQMLFRAFNTVYTEVGAGVRDVRHTVDQKQIESTPSRIIYGDDNVVVDARNMGSMKNSRGLEGVATKSAADFGNETWERSIPDKGQSDQRRNFIPRDRVTYGNF